MAEYRGAWYPKPYPNGQTSRFYRIGAGAGGGGAGLWDAVNYGVRAIQLGLQRSGGGFSEIVVDGHFAPQTERFVRVWQGKLGLAVDGVFGPLSARKMFGAIVENAEKLFGIPNNYLAGMVDLESGWDPGAVGANGFDSGLFQINLDPVSGHGKAITVLQAFDPTWATNYSGNRVAVAANVYREQLDQLAWKLAVGQHNSPLAAKLWLVAALREPPGLGDDPEVVERVTKNIRYVELVDRRIP